MCCAAQDPSRDDRRERKRAEAANPFYKSQRRGVAAGAGDLAGKQAGLVGVGIVLSHRRGEAGNGIFVESFVDGPSRDSGRIFPGDQLLAIDKHDIESACIEDLTYLLPGTPGSTVAPAPPPPLPPLEICAWGLRASGMPPRSTSRLFQPYAAAV